MLLCPNLRMSFLLALSLATATVLLVVAADDEGASADPIDTGAIDIDSLNLQPDTPKSDSNKDRQYVSPKIKQTEDVLLFETFDNLDQFGANWVQSQDPKYEGRWEVISGPDSPTSDLQLLLTKKARHYAISSKLKQPFKFSDGSPLIVQYEVQYRDGIDCAGAYIKLLRHSATNDLKLVNNESPYSIMFGPDKCGSVPILHFIIQYLNPKTQEYSEKHWKQAKSVTDLMSTFNDKEHHIYKLVLNPNNNFEVYLDDKVVGKGNLLEDLEPPVNPPKEIVDPNDKKPVDWDERPQIEDLEAKKPDDWDEDAPKTIEDPNAVKPSDWLDNESKFIKDPDAKKPDDWEEMDGEWEPPLIENPACSKVSGCGEWKAPSISNPNFKGKWKPPKIDNPNYKGKWSPRNIPNPDYYYDENPFSSLDSIGAVTYEVWSMADNIAFDNLIVTRDPEAAQLFQHLTWREKKAASDASSPSVITRATHLLKTKPWLWIGVIVAIALSLFAFIHFCCDSKKKQRNESAKRKKIDESRADGPRPGSKDQPEADDQDDHAEEQDDDDDKEVDDDDEEADEVVEEKPSSRRRK